MADHAARPSTTSRAARGGSRLLRSLFCGLYTVDNMDFVLRDAFMSGYSTRAYDLDRLLRYSFFSERGLTIHHRGLNALLRFMQTKSELFRAVYFHRTVRAIDKTLEGLFRDSKGLLFPGNPLEHLEDYKTFTEWSLLVDVAHWHKSENVAKRALGERWQRLLARQVDWDDGLRSQSHLRRRRLRSRRAFSAMRRWSSTPSAASCRARWPTSTCRSTCRGTSTGRTKGRRRRARISSTPPAGATRRLDDDQLFRQLPVSHRMCRVYLRKDSPQEQVAAIGAALDQLVGSGGEDDLTNM